MLRGKFAEQINIFQPSHHLVIILLPGPSNSYFNLYKKINQPCLKVTVIDIFWKRNNGILLMYTTLFKNFKLFGLNFWATFTSEVESQRWTVCIHNLSKLVDLKKADTCHKILGCVAQSINIKYEAQHCKDTSIMYVRKWLFRQWAIQANSSSLINLPKAVIIIVCSRFSSLFLSPLTLTFHWILWKSRTYIEGT